MPFYDYVCDSCQHTFEELLSASAPNPPCPKCESEEVHRQIPSTFAVGQAQPKPAAGLPPGCGRCGDPRGPGACSMR